MLEKSLNKQVKLAAWGLAIGAFWILGYILIIVGLIDTSTDDYGTTHENFPLIIIGGLLAFTCFIASFVIWILGIVNAVNINSQTGSQATVLVVFSILTFWFGHLIVAISTRNKYRSGAFGDLTNIPARNQAISQPKINSNNSYEDKLKHAFMDGFISSEEYQKKLKDHRNK